MAAQEDDRFARLHPAAVEKEGEAENVNSKTRTDPENDPSASAHSLSLGEKRKAPSAFEDDEGQKKLKPFTMKVTSRMKGGDAKMQDKTSKSGGITMRFGAAKPMKIVSLKLNQKPKEPEIKAPACKAVAKAFADESDEEEEMPPEAKMRMKNVGRETPTSAGPNSYNKSKQGFNDHARVWKKDIDAKTGSVDPEKK